MFIETTKKGKYVNVNHVTAMQVNVDSHGTETVSLHDAEGRLLGECWTPDAFVARLNIIPAPIGYSVLVACIEENSASLFEQPIIAFGYGNGSPVPFTADGVWEDDHRRPSAIKHPSGVVIEADASQYESSEAFLAAKLKEHNRPRLVGTGNDNA